MSLFDQFPTSSLSGLSASGGGPGSTLTPTVNAMSSGPQFSNIQSALAPPASGIAAPYQSAIDMINKQRDYYANLGAASAQGLAAKRGLSGSSIEQFGTQSAINQVNNAALSQTSALLGQGANAQNSNTQLGANLTSDEIASLRNMDLSKQYMAMQQSLGQQGIDVSRQNISSAQDIAQQQARNSLIQSGASLLAPSLLNSFRKLNPGTGDPSIGLGVGGGGGSGSGGGFLSSLNPFSSAGIGSTTPSTLSGSAYNPGFVPQSSMVPQMTAGQVGTSAPGMFGAGGSLFNTAGTSSLGMGDVLPGVAGWQAGTAAFGDNRYTNVGGIGGAAVGSIFGPLGSAAGGFLGTAAGKYGDQANTSLQHSLGNTGAALAKPFIDPIGTAVDIASNPGKKIGQAVSGAVNTVKNIFPF